MRNDIELNQDNASSQIDTIEMDGVFVPNESLESTPKSRVKSERSKSASKSTRKSSKTTNKSRSKSTKREPSKLEAKSRSKSATKSTTRRADLPSRTTMRKAAKHIIRDTIDAVKPKAPLGVAQRVLGIEGDYEDDEETVPIQRPKQLRYPRVVREFIVIRTACCVPPRVIVGMVKEEFGLTITSALVEKYDPSKANGQALSNDLKELWAHQQREYHAVVSRLGMGDPAWRLARLQEMAISSQESGAFKLAASLLKQGAQEVGGAFVKVPKQTEDRRSLLAALLNCSSDDLPPIPKTGLALPAKGGK